MTAADGSLSPRFEAARPRLGALAYRMLGSVDDAQDAVQEAWLRLSADTGEAITNLDAWLTTVVARICLNALRDRHGRGREELVARLPDPIVDADGESDPEHRALLADAVGLALFVVLDTLPPAERLAFVLHDLFAIPFEEVAPIVDRTPAATRQLASRARRRVERRTPVPDPDLARQRVVVDAFFAAAHEGDLERLVGVLDPDVVLRSDTGAGIAAYLGARKVASNAIMYAHPDRVVHPALVNGAAGVVVTLGGALFSVMAFTVVEGRVVEIAAYTEPALLERLEKTLDLGA